MFDLSVQLAAQQHARAQYPHEAVGFVIDGVYVPQENIADDPSKTFKVALECWPLSQPLQAVIHSHIDTPIITPSKEDMAGQIASAVPWGLLTVTAEKVSDLVWWGPGVAIPDLIRRPYRPGPSGSDGKGDCYALVKDWFELERGVKLQDFARDEDDFLNGFDLYRDNFEGQGFRTINAHEIKRGDCCLMQIRTKVPNHAAVFLGKGLGIHHLQNTLSRSDNLGRYKNLITHWLRHESNE